MALGAALLASGCATSRATDGRVLYELSSPDVGVDWHLHEHEGAFVCALPCEQSIGPKSGEYLVVHDPNKAWRVDMPSSLPGAPGSKVWMDVRVGKGSPTLGTVGGILGAGGALVALTGLTLLIIGVIDFVQCSPFNTASASMCTTTDTGTAFTLAGGISLAVGLSAGAAGVYLVDHNKSATVKIRLTGTGIAGSF
jgi:hypothetical protein